jgi:hypothetical protein
VIPSQGDSVTRRQGKRRRAPFGSALSNPSSPRAVFLSAIPAIIQTMNDGISQGDDKQLKILHTLLSLITDFSTIHSKLLAKVRAFVLGFFFSSLTDGLALLLRFRLHE